MSADPRRKIPVMLAKDHALNEHKIVMSKLLESHEGADLTLVCGSDSYPVHSFLLKPRSAFFEAAFTGGFKEAQTNKIDLPEDNSHSIQRMLEYCYLMDYSDAKKADSDLDKDYVSRTHINAEMYALADKYDIAGLKEVAAEKFNATLLQEYRDTDDVGPNIMKQLVAVASIVHNGTPEKDRRLRSRVNSRVWALWCELADLSEFRALIASNPQFIIDVVQSQRGLI